MIISAPVSVAASVIAPTARSPAIIDRVIPGRHVAPDMADLVAETGELVLGRHLRESLRVTQSSPGRRRRSGSP
jgi:hypothetical protein